MSNIVVPVLSVTVGLFFVLVGTIKLTPFISEEFYREMVGFCGSRAELQTSFPRPFVLFSEIKSPCEEHSFPGPFVLGLVFTLRVRIENNSAVHLNVVVVVVLNYVCI